MLRVFVAVNILWLLFWHHFVCRLTGYGLLTFLKDMAPYLGLSVVLCIGAYFLFSGVTHLLAEPVGESPICRHNLLPHAVVERLCNLPRKPAFPL